MHHSTSTDEIKAELMELGHEVENIINFINKETQIKKNLFFIDLKRNDNNSKIFEIKRFMNSVLVFEEPHKKRELPQCKRCQCYGHTRNQCTRPYRCVKCAGDHDYRSCLKQKSDGTPAKCVLCNGSHPANYKGCTVYQEIINRKQPIRNGAGLQNQSYANQNLFRKRGTEPTVNATYQSHANPDPQSAGPNYESCRQPSYAKALSRGLQPAFNSETFNPQPETPGFNFIIQTMQSMIQNQQEMIAKLTTEVSLLREQLTKALQNKNGGAI